MRKACLILIVVLLIAACATSQPEPTSTPLPPTEPPPPTETSVPPTKGPNPHAEAVLLAFAEAVSDREYENAKEYFSEDVKMKDPFTSYEGMSGLDSWLDVSEAYDDFYKLSEFVVIGDDVEFKWFANSRTRDEKMMCKGFATMSEDKIVYLQMTECN